MRKFIFILFCLFGCCMHLVSTAQKDSMMNLGVDLFNKGEYEKSAEILLHRLEVAKSAKDHKMMVILYSNLGNDYSSMGKAKEALEYYQKSLSLAEQIGDKRAIGKSYNNIGTLYSDMKDFPKALQNFADAERVAISIRDTATLADCANNKGLIFEQQKKYDDALNEYKKAINDYVTLGQDDRIAILYNNLGIVYKYLKSYDTSIACYNTSLEYSRKIGSKFLIAANQVNIGNVYEMKGDYQHAIELNLQGLKTGEEIKSTELVIEVLDNLSREYALAGDYKQGYEIHKRYADSKDSFMTVERSKQLAEMQTKYETQKKETKIVALEKSRILMLSISGLLVLLLVIMLLLFSRQRAKQKQEREKAILEAERNERNRLAKDIHDDLGSGLSMISLIAHRAQTTAADGKKLGNALATDQNKGNRETLTEKIIEDNILLGKDVVQIANVSRELIDNMRDMIWILKPESTRLDQLTARIREYCLDTLENLPIELDMELTENYPDLKITRQARRNIFLTFKEALNNCLKYAGATKISISLSLDKDKTLAMSISDNGAGFDPGNTRSGGNGLKNMRQRTENLGGKFEISGSGGTTIRISIPASGLTETKILL